MGKWIAVEVEPETHKVYQAEAFRLSDRTGERVTLGQVVKAELERGRQRLVNKHRATV